jgi:tetratricopeptide (TPR) repeat protein
LSAYTQAAAIDDHFAELLFRMARCAEAVGRLDEARRFYLSARDWDALQFRTDGRINELARRVASEAGVSFADVAERCATNNLSQNGVPGQALFQEHVHFTFEGDHTVASLLLPDIATAFQLPPPSGPGLSRSDCAARLAYTEVDDYNVRASTARLVANPPFQDQLEHAVRVARLDGELKQRAAQATPQTFERALAAYQQAVAAQPADWMIRFNYGNLLKQVGQHGAAAAEFGQVVKVLPGQRAFRLAYGDALLSAGRFREAAEQFEAALKLDPDLEPARQGLKAAKARR